MKPYKKPTIVSVYSTDGLFPAIVGPIFGAIKIGAPVIAGLAALAASKKGNSVINSTHTSTLTERKDFSFA